MTERTLLMAQRERVRVALSEADCRLEHGANAEQVLPAVFRARAEFSALEALLDGAVDLLAVDAARDSERAPTDVSVSSPRIGCPVHGPLCPYSGVCDVE